MNSDILQIAPTFLEGARKLHDNLAGVTIICALCGLMIIASQAMQEKQLNRFWPLFVRMGVASFLLTGLGTWGDMLNDAMADLINQAGWGQFPGSVAADYQAAIAKKWGTASIGQTQNQGTTTQVVANSSSRGVQLTHYGYEQPGQAYYDSKSAQGIGAFTFDDTPGSLQNINATGVQAAALSPDVAQRYGVQPGQQFTVQIASGQTFNLVYADKTAADLTGRIDIYDPNGSFQGSGTQVTSIAGGAVIEGSPTATAGGGGGFNLINPATWGPTLISVIVNAIVYFISVAALLCMIIMTIVQQLLYAIELAVSPIFIGLWLIPGLTNVATRFFTSLAAILLWPLGWVVSDLGTKFFLDLAVNPIGNGSQTAVSLAGIALSGGTLAVGFWILLAGWVVLSSFVAPGIVSALIVTGGSGIERVFASALGVGTYMAYTAAKSAGGAGPLGSVVGSATSGGNSPVAGRASRPNYARRPPAPPPAVV
jgi:hypothetical protein